MKYVKMLGLLAVAAAAMMAFAATASATTLTSPAGTTYTGTIHATNENGHVSLHGENGVTIECASTVEGKVEKHGTGVTVEGAISALTFTGCTNESVVTVLKKGTLIAHNIAGTTNGTLTSTGTEVKASVKSLFGTIECVYTTKETDIGTLTSSAVTNATATLDISATIPRTGGSALCGANGVWTGNYIVDTPMELFVDA